MKKTQQIIGEIKQLRKQNKKMRKVLEFASEELGRTGCGEGEWIHRLLQKINKVLEYE